jgi:hypothetical protein
VTRFPADGTDDSIVDWTESGVVAISGNPDGPPLVPPGRAASVARELIGRLRPHIRDADAVRDLDGGRLLAERAALLGLGRAGRVSAGGSCRLLPAEDGWVALSAPREDDRWLLGAAMGRELPEDWWPCVARWVRARPAGALVEAAAQLGVAVARVGEATGSPTPAVIASPPGAPVRRREGRPALVVDFSALWAGPLCAHLLGLTGARVVKVETPDRPDGARRGHPGFYDLLHSGHMSVVLDPRTREGRRAMAELVAAADVVIEASRPRALAGFGLDAAARAATGAVWVSITAYGRDVDRVGFGDDVAAGAGLVAADPRDGAPVFCGDAIADPLTGITAAAAVIDALAEGRGRLLDVAMSRVVAATLDGTPSRLARRGGGDAAHEWYVETSTGARAPVLAPVARPVPPPAPPSGADTSEVLAALAIGGAAR